MVVNSDLRLFTKGQYIHDGGWRMKLYSKRQIHYLNVNEYVSTDMVGGQNSWKNLVIFSVC